MMQVSSSEGDPFLCRVHVCFRRARRELIQPPKTDEKKGKNGKRKASAMDAQGDASSVAVAGVSERLLRRCFEGILVESNDDVRGTIQQLWRALLPGVLRHETVTHILAFSMATTRSTVYK